MEAILNMLSQPDELETASRRVKIVLADLDKAFTPSSKTAGLAGARGAVKEDNSLKLNPTDAQKVDALYACLPRIEPLMPLVPPLLTRLRSLATLHAGASAFQSTLSTLETDADNMKETDIEVKEVLDRLDEGITKQAQVMKANWGSLSERLQQLNERVVRLQT
jgi:nuclear migration protein JNM1